MEWIFENTELYFVPSIEIKNRFMQRGRNSDDGYFIPAATVIPDVVDSMEWIFENTELYFVPSIEIKNRFMQRGISPDKVEVVGVPISSYRCCG